MRSRSCWRSFDKPPNIGFGLSRQSRKLIQYHKAAELYDRAMDQFERLYAEGEHTARIMAIAVHPYISGVPHRIAPPVVVSAWKAPPFLISKSMPV